MRAFAEEKRTGTYEFLLTAPIRTGEIVAGKFIAAAVFILIMVALAWLLDRSAKVPTLFVDTSEYDAAKAAAEPGKA